MKTDPTFYQNLSNKLEFQAHSPIKYKLYNIPFGIL